MRTHNYGPRERSKFHYIDLYSVNFEVVVSGPMGIQPCATPRGG